MVGADRPACMLGAEDGVYVSGKESGLVIVDEWLSVEGSMSGASGQMRGAWNPEDWVTE